MPLIATLSDMTKSAESDLESIKRVTKLFLVSDKDELLLNKRLEEARTHYDQIVEHYRNANRSIAASLARKQWALGTLDLEKNIQDLDGVCARLAEERDRTVRLYRDSAAQQWSKSPRMLKLGNNFASQVRGCFDRMIEAQKTLRRELLELQRTHVGVSLPRQSLEAYLVAYSRLVDGVKMVKTEHIDTGDDYYPVMTLGIPDNLYSDPEALTQIEIQANDLVSEHEPDLFGLCIINYAPLSEQLVNEPG
jgi:hypothetical protein